MSRTQLPYVADDISALSRSLVSQLSQLDHLPGHVEMLNLLAGAVGFRNFQHWRAARQAADALAAPAPLTPEIDYALVRRLLRYFDAQGRLQAWPTKHSHRAPCLWVVWSHLPPRQAMSEREVNDAIRAVETLGDHLLLRRQMVDDGMLTRTADGAVYRRVEQAPPPLARALLAALAGNAAT
ncbi:DUF2087 domain-containing protein [Chitiniphilus shinanonensis]|uniref:DUF2087 domain-containing protein n=1 Tax=Chitiniphilus shinanonensis TaxID=553088 RepID=UPI0030568436